MEEHEFQQLIDEITHSETDSNVLTLLFARASVCPLSESNFHSLVDVVLLSSLPSVTRRSLLERLLIPSQDKLLPHNLLLKLLAAIGPPEVYIRSGKKCKLKRLPSDCQLAILNWLFETIPFYGNSVFRFIRLMFPILFSLLSHEYCRRHIASLIIIGTLNQKDHVHHPFKLWHIEIVMSLLKSYPHDPSLSILRWIICKAGRTPRDDNPGNFETPSNEDFTLSMVKISGNLIEKAQSFHGVTPCEFYREILAVWEAIKSNQECLVSRMSSCKRIRLSNASLNEKITSKEVTQTLLSNSLEDVARNFGHLNKINFKFISETNIGEQRLQFIQNVLSTLVLSSHSISDVFQSNQELFEAIDSIDPSLVDKLHEAANYGLFLTFQADTILHCIMKNNDLAQLARVRILISLMPHINKEISNELAMAILGNGEVVAKKKLLSNFFTNVALNYGKAVKLGKSGENGLFFVAFPFIYLYVTKNWSLMGLRCQLSFTRLLRFVLKLILDEKCLSHVIYHLIPPPSLVYQLLISANPLIVTEILGIISSLKSLKFNESEAIHKKLINSLVYDGVNFIWKDLAFKYEGGSFNKGMYLGPHFVHCMGRLNFFGSSDFLMLKTVGGISRNPAFAYLCAEIVWSIEDAQDDISMRHPGPLSEESVLQIQTDPDESWVRMSYKDIKNSVLHQLVDYGFEGLGDFLYSSVRSLRYKRHRSIS